MRILMIGPFPPPIHGMSLANITLKEGLGKRAHQIVTIDTHTGRTFGNLKNQGRFSFQKVWGSLVGIVKGIWAILFGFQPEFVYITPAQSQWGYLKYTPFIFAAAIRRIPTFIHIHGGYFRTMFDGSRGWKRWLIEKSLSLLTGVIVLGSSLRYMFEGIVPEEKILYCPNGVENDIFASEEEINQKIKNLNIEPEVKVLYMSNLMRSKGVLDLLEAVMVLKNEGHAIHLNIAGAIEPDIEQEIEEYFKLLGEAVTYHGVVQGQVKKDLFLKNEIFCLPSGHPLGEGQPLSILEAMANGCFIVTTDIGGIKDIASGPWATFVNKHDPTDLALKLKTPINASVLRQGWEEAKRKYIQGIFIKRIEEILDRAMKLDGKA